MNSSTANEAPETLARCLIKLAPQAWSIPCRIAPTSCSQRRIKNKHEHLNHNIELVRALNKVLAKAKLRNDARTVCGLAEATTERLGDEYIPRLPTYHAIDSRSETLIESWYSKDRKRCEHHVCSNNKAARRLDFPTSIGEPRH